MRANLPDAERPRNRAKNGPREARPDLAPVQPTAASRRGARDPNPRASVRNPENLQGLGSSAAKGGGASRVGGRVVIGVLLPLIVACAGLRPAAPPEVHTAPPPSDVERYCAWFGDTDDDTLYFGESAFWSAMRDSGAAQDPRADLEHEGPVLVGRFDLEHERLLDPLDVGRRGDRSGTWDVLAHPNGRVYFTRYFESAGWVDPGTGEVRRLPGLGTHLNELALGPDATIYASRYPGGVVVFDEEGRLLAEHELPAPPGYQAAPKTVGVDPRSGDIWLSMDLLPVDRTANAPIRHDAYVLDAGGGLLRTIARPELQFVAFGPDGTGYRAEVADGELALRIVPPGTDPLDAEAGRLVLLDAAFLEGYDFAQDVRPLADGGAIVTRWSGTVHRVHPEGRVRTLRLPRLDGGIYYTAVLHDGRVCATWCGNVSVVCADAP